ncbi:MAG TPA: hypothetical protein D7I11_00015 [Candidatus Poseidoniales archaeon]|nr:hypothetical protein [Euryarchaeota archaeon]DAC56896.1 MAG TPA: hypothetical protein D7I11_00015 [Candidatus Poseidoniales archaeon]HII26776.1 hypothetical protein [Poseidonia sp.]
MEEPPAPWTEVEVEAQYTVTLFAFSWALLPVMFMLMMTVFDRYENHRLPLAAAALLMLVLAFVSGVGQRRSAWSEGRVQLATASLVGAAASLGLVWGLNLVEWWWVPYGLVFGSVATMFVALNRLASCTTPTIRCAWPAQSRLPMTAFDGWRIHHGAWTNGTMGNNHLSDGTILTLFGQVDNDATYLCIDRLCPVELRPKWDALGVDFGQLAIVSNALDGEE